MKRADSGGVSGRLAALIWAQSALLTGCLILFCSAPAWAEPVALDGEWDVLYATAPDFPPATEGWSKATFPACLHGAGDGGVWVKRSFALGADAVGQRQVLRLWGAYFEPRIWVNGQSVLDGSEPLELPLDLDITSAVVQGQNELLIWMRDWSALQHTKVPMTGLGVNEDPRGRCVDKLVEPVPPDFLCFGLLDSVTLRSVPSVRVDDIVVESTLIQGNAGTAKVQPALFNAGVDPVQVRIDGVVLNAAGDQVTSFGQENVWVYPGIQRIVLPVTTGLDHPWSPSDPYLYRVRVELKQGSVLVHQLEADFGFRQVTTNKGLMLNGSPFVGGMEELWPEPRFYQAGAALAEIQRLKARGAQVVALMGGRWPQAWYTAADQLGVMLFASGNLDCDPFGTYKYTLAEFTAGAQRDLSNVLRLIAAHPSVVGIAVERRLIACGDQHPATMAVRRTLVQTLMTSARSEDDSRPLFTPGDLDGTGEPDADWLVYGGTLADRASPQRWSTLFTEGLTLPGLTTPWSWSQSLPLIVSGLGVPDGAPDAINALLGSGARYAQALATYLAGETFRRVREILWLKGASLVAPEATRPDRPTFMLPGSLPDWRVPMPIEWVYRSFGSHFWAESSRPLRWDVIATGAKRLTSGKIRIRGPQGEVLVERGINMAPGEMLTLDVMVKAPAVPEGEPWAEFSVLLEVEADYMVETRTETFRAYPTVEVPKLPDSVNVLDPLNALPDSVKPASGGTVLESLTDLLTAGRLVVVGPNAFNTMPAPSTTPTVYENLEQLLLFYVENGGTLLVFQQERYDGIVPFDLTTGGPLAVRGLAGHEVTDGLDSSDLSGWKSSDGSVADRVILPPRWGSFRCLLTAPVAGAQEACLLAEVRRGQGVLLLLEVDLGALAAQEPVAATLLARLVEYAVAQSETIRSAARVVAMTPALDSVLQQLDLNRYPSEQAGACGEVVLQSSSETITDTYMSDLGKSFAGVKLVWLVIDQLQQASGLSPWKEQPLDVPAATGLPLLATSDLGKELADVLYQTLFPENQAGAVRMGGVPVAVSPLAYAAEDLVGGEGGCLLPGQEAVLAVEPSSGQSLRIDLVADVTSPLEEAVVLSVSGQQTQSVLLNPGQGLSAVVALPLGVYGDGLVRFRNESLVQDAVTGVAAKVCLSSVSVGVVASFPEGELATLPALWIKSLAWGYPAVLDATGRMTSGAHEVGGFAAVSRFLSRQGAVVDTPVGVRFEASQLDVIDSQLNGLESDGLFWLRDNGALAVGMSFPATGPYRVLVSGKGRPANGTWPQAEVRLDGVSQGTITLGQELSTYYVDLQVEKGTHNLAVAFVNDAYLPPEDRDAGFGTVEVLALRSNQPPMADIAFESQSDGMHLSARCAWDADGEALTYTWSWAAEGCYGSPLGTSEGESVVADAPYGSYWVTMVAKDARNASVRVCRQYFHDGAAVVEPVEEAVEPLADVVTSEDVQETISYDFQIGETQSPVDEGAPQKKDSGSCSASPASQTNTSLGGLSFLAALALLVLFRRRQRA